MDDSHIVHIAGVGHLLDVDASGLLNSSKDLTHSSLYQVLDVHKTAPNVAHVIKWVSCWARIPKPDEKYQKSVLFCFLKSKCWRKAAPEKQNLLVAR